MNKNIIIIIIISAIIVSALIIMNIPREYSLQISEENQQQAEIQSTPCSSECPVGQRECIGTQQYRLCRDYNSDSCYEWGGN